jgi:hypothetical protein
MSLFKRGNVYWSYVYVRGVRYSKSTGTSNLRTATRPKRRTNMDGKNHVQDLGHELGQGGIDRLVEQVEAVCLHERRKIELTNEPEIVRLRMEFASWCDEEKRISEQLRLAPPPGDRRSRRIEAWMSGGFATLLTVAGFFFSLLALDPFRLGWERYILCIGIAILCPYGIHRCLKEWDCRSLIRMASTIATAAALASLILLAVIRGNLFIQQLQDEEARAVVIDDNGFSQPQTNHFYETTLPLLRAALALLALAMDLESGLALHEAMELGMDSGIDREKLSERRIAIRSHLAALGSQITAHIKDGERFEAQFWSNFHRSMITRTVSKGIGKFLSLFLIALLMSAVGAKAQESGLNLVVAVDLSASVAAKGPDGKSDFQKNVEAVALLLSEVPPGSRVTVIGITANSFGEPDILLSAQVGADQGYFGERLKTAHKQLVRAWQDRAQHISPAARQTDILGAVRLAAQLTDEMPLKKKAFVIYSDMRQATSELNLEGNGAANRGTSKQEFRGQSPSLNLTGVDVYALGVDASGANPAMWERLKQFWSKYFQTAGANLRSYLVLRDPPSL